MPRYKIASQEGTERYGAETGTTVELDLDPGEELAVIAAGWLEHTKQKPEEANT